MTTRRSQTREVGSWSLIYVRRKKAVDWVERRTAEIIGWEVQILVLPQSLFVYGCSKREGLFPLFFFVYP
jgi:hypothetical protein